MSRAAPQSTTDVCPACGYPRIGLAADGVCPECGAPPGAAVEFRLGRRDVLIAACVLAPVACALAVAHALSPQRGDIGAAVGVQGALVRAGSLVWLGAGCWVGWARGGRQAPVVTAAVILVVSVFGLVLLDVAMWLAVMIVVGP